MTSRTTDTAGPLLLDMETAAERIGVTLRCLRGLVHTDQAPPSRRIGKRRYFRAADVEAWINEQFQDSH